MNLIDLKNIYIINNAVALFSVDDAYRKYLDDDDRKSETTL